jgi:hypothetical protein
MRGSAFGLVQSLQILSPNLGKDKARRRAEICSFVAQMTNLAVPAILFAMNALLDKAIAAVSKLPEAEQEAIARDVLDRLAADEHWSALLADPRSAATLGRLASEARADVARGDVLDFDPATSQK